jgi:hypothetical protein
MSITPTAGIAGAWSAAREAGASPAVEVAIVRQAAEAEQSLVAMIDEAARAAPDPSPPPPPGQGRFVDVRV